MRRKVQQFTKNKDQVRNLQRELIEKHFAGELGVLRYFGLPSSALGDAISWASLFTEFVAVERGEKDREWELQHELEVAAFRAGIFSKILLLRGDIDSVISKGKDQYGNKVRFPFDVVSLDYSGGLFYRDAQGAFGRLRAIAGLIRKQAVKQKDFILLISCNLDHIDQGEIRRTIANIKTDLIRYGVTGDQVVKSYLDHSRDEARLKVYVPYFVNQEGAKNRYQCETANVIFYEGNLKTRMMAFRFYMTFDLGTESLRSPRERLSQIINKPLLEIIDGTATESSLSLPKLVLAE